MGGVTRVVSSDANSLICKKFCGTCPSHPGTDELLFCANGKSAKPKKVKEGCKCMNCEVQKEYGCTGSYYCMEGPC